MSKKRIGIDMRMMKPFPTGIGSHYITLIRALVESYPEHEYILIINTRNESFIKKRLEGLPVSYKKIPINGGSYVQYLLSLYLYLIYKRLRLDILLTDIWSFSLLNPQKYALMLYDLIGFHKVVPVSTKQKLFDAFMYRFAGRNACCVIASSEFVKKDCIRFLQVQDKKIAIAMPSVSEEYTFQIDDQKEIRRKYNIPEKYIVYIGNRRPHKNLQGALEIWRIVMQRLKEKDLYFVIIGGMDSEKATNSIDIETVIAESYHDIKSSVIITGRIHSNYEVAAILKGAILLLHPTLFEGYGLTPLEAMNVGTAVVSTDIPVIREVIKDAGVLCQKGAYSEFAEQVVRLISDTKLRKSYEVRGLNRSHEITWKNAAENLHAALMSCM